MEKSVLASRRRDDWIWAAMAAVVAAGPFIAGIAAGRTFVWRDTARLFVPARHLVVEALRAGRLPLWNPYDGLGAPLLAQTIHGVFHPVSAAAALLAPGASMDAIIAAHAAVASLGAFWLARGLGASAPAAAVAGIGYALSGYVSSMTSFVQLLGAAALAPWVAASLLQVGRRSRFAIPISAIMVAFMVFAGDPQGAIVATLLGMILAWAVGGGAGLGRAVLTVSLGALLASIQILPAWAYFREADRSVGLAAIDRAQWALPLPRILELALPGLFYGRPGQPTAPVFLWLGDRGQYPIPFASSISVGVAVLWLAARGVPASRASRALAVASIVLLWMALGTQLGADELLRYLPVWGAFRYSEKLVAPLTLCLSVLAALGVDRVVPAVGTTWRFAAVAALAGAMAVLLASWPGATDLFRGLGAGGAAEEARIRLATGLGHSALAAALLAGALLASIGPRRRSWFPGLAVGAVAVAASAALPLAVHAGAHIPPDPTILAVVRSGTPVPRIATPVPVAWGPGWLDNWDRTQWAESRMGYPSHSARFGVANISHIVGILPLRYVLVAGAFREQFGPAASVAWRRLGLTHVVLGMTTTTGDAATASASVEGGRKVMEEPEWRTSVWEVPHRPWISFAPGAIKARSIEESLDRLIESMAAGQPEVVLEGEPPDAYGEGRILSADRGREWVRVEATTDRPGLLVLNEAWSPGWEARIDGVPVRVLPADVLVRAVAWPAGHHVLEMRYEPKEARLGVWMSLVGAFVVLAMTVVNAVARRW